mgnify:CR=1 FL=1
MALTGSYGDLYDRQLRTLIEHELQQKGSVLLPCVTREAIGPADSTWFPKIGQSTSYEVTGRNQAVDIQDQTYERRGIVPVLLEGVHQINAIDMARYKRSPQPELVESLARQLGRQFDVHILTALSGSALRELNGSSSAASFDSNNTIAVSTNTFAMKEEGGGALTGDTGLHEGKILQAINKLQTAYALEPGDEIFVVGPSIQLTGLKARALRGDSAGLYQNSPNIGVPMADKALQGFLGCTFIQYENTGVDGSSDQYVYIFTRKAIKFAIIDDIAFNSMVQLDKKGNPTLHKCNATVGAVRMWEEAVVRVLCDPTPTYATA